MALCNSYLDFNLHTPPGVAWSIDISDDPLIALPTLRT